MQARDHLATPSSLWFLNIGFRDRLRIVDGDGKARALSLDETPFAP